MINLNENLNVLHESNTVKYALRGIRSTKAAGDMMITGNFDPFKEYCMKEVAKCTEIEYLQYLKKDIGVAKNQINTLADNLEAYMKDPETAVKERKLNPKFMEKHVKGGQTPEKLHAYLKWLETDYMTAINNRIKELKTGKPVSESSMPDYADNTDFNIPDESDLNQHTFDQHEELMRKKYPNKFNPDGSRKYDK